MPAQQEFTKVIAAAPEWPLGWRNLALAQLAANDRAGAVATLEKGVPKTNWDFSLVADLAALYERNGEFDKAISTYEQMVAKRRGIEAAENNLAMLLVTYRKDQKSLDRARELTEQFANSPNAALLDTHGWVLYRRGQYAEALTAAGARQPACATGARREVPSRHGAVQERPELAGAREPPGRAAEQVGLRGRR